MKFYSTSAAVMTTVRKCGHYPSSRTAAFLAKRIAYVLDRESMSTQIASCLKGNTVGMNRCRAALTPAEFQVIWDLLEWWAKDNVSDSLIRQDDRAFFCVDLNTGRTLMILDRS